jgi:hypothetical protein
LGQAYTRDTHATLLISLRTWRRPARRGGFHSARLLRGGGYGASEPMAPKMSFTLGAKRGREEPDEPAGGHPNVGGGATSCRQLLSSNPANADARASSDFLSLLLLRRFLHHHLLSASLPSPPPPPSPRPPSPPVQRKSSSLGLPISRAPLSRSHLRCSATPGDAGGADGDGEEEEDDVGGL